MGKIPNLFEYYERDINSDVLALINTGKRISGKKNLMIKFNNTHSPVYTDGYCIYLPKFCEEKIKPAQGFVAHESGHIGYGSFEIGFLKLMELISKKYKIPIPIVKDLTNVLEDVRINTINKKQFPGFYKNLRDYTLEVLPQIISRMKRYEDLFIYLNLFMEDYSNFQKKPNFNSINLTDKDWEKICVLKSFLLKALTPNATIIALDQICKLLKKYIVIPEKRNLNLPSNTVVVSDIPRRGIISPFRSNEKFSKDVIILTAVEDFIDERINKKPTSISKTSEEMMKKINNMDLSIDDIKALTNQIDKIEKQNNPSDTNDIETTIGKKINDLTPKGQKKGNKIDEIIKDLQSLQDSGEKSFEKQNKKNEIVKNLKDYCKKKQKLETKEINKIKEDIQQVNNIIEDLEDLKNPTEIHENKEKKNKIRKKITEYLKKVDSDKSKTKQEKEDLREVFGDLFKSIEEEKESDKNQKKRSEIIEKLKKTSVKKEKELQRKSKDLNHEINEINDIINDIENIDYSAKDPNNKKQKENALSKLKTLNNKIKKFQKNENGDNPYDSVNKDLLGKLVIDITKAKEELRKRIAKIGLGIWSLDPAFADIKRDLIETKIEQEDMIPIKLTYNQIIENYKAIITKMKLIFNNLKPTSEFDNYQKLGRLNKNFIKTVTSNYQFKNCFTRKIRHKLLRIILLVDISGSMNGKKLEAAKIAMIILVESLKELAAIRIVLFTGNRNARNILVKDFHEPLDPKKVDKVGCHEKDKSNLDGVSLQQEASKVHNKEVFIIISDGKPAGHLYGLNQAMNQVQKVRKTFKVFAFSIDAEGDHLNKMYGKNWILAKSFNKIDLSQKIMQFSRLVVKEFY